MSMLGAAVATDAVVVERTREGPYIRLAFDVPQIASAAQPGAFVSLAQQSGERILRKPFSILDARDDVVEVAFDVAGPGTAWLAQRRPGDLLDVIGPLGNAFAPAPEGSTVLLVGGGYGTAPLLFYARRLREAGVRTRLVLGAATQHRLFMPERARFQCDEVVVTTDDGSAGVRGRVTDAMAAMRDLASLATVATCGPMAMLAAVSRATPDAVPVQVAVEEFMGCGIGVCWTCVVPTHADGYRHHVRSCIEGPIFDGRAIAWA